MSASDVATIVAAVHKRVGYFAERSRSEDARQGARACPSGTCAIIRLMTVVSSIWPWRGLIGA
jgi:hypothetical protein